VLGIPRPHVVDTVRRIGIVHPEGLNDGSLEPIALPDLRGRDVSAHCVAPNLGWLAYRFPVADARAAAAALVARNVQLYTAPTIFSCAPYGRITLFSVRTPDGAIIEFFSREAR
jgi:hypothetical protein